LNNPELQNSMVDAEYQLKTEQAKYTDLQMTLEKQGLDQKAAAATVNSEYKQAQLKADRDKELAKEGLIPDLDEKLSTVKPMSCCSAPSSNWSGFPSPNNRCKLSCQRKKPKSINCARCSS